MNVDATCTASVFARYGFALVVVLTIPVVLCALPAYRPFPWSTWLVAATLIVGPILAVGATDTMFATWIYYLPFGAAAVVVAVLERRRERMGVST